MTLQAGTADAMLSTGHLTGTGMANQRIGAAQPCVATSYFEWAQRELGSKAEGLRRLNDALGTAYSASHISRWERRHREPDRATRMVMLAHILGPMLEQRGIKNLDRKAVREFAERIV
jgi:hypothetical protein